MTTEISVMYGSEKVKVPKIQNTVTTNFSSERLLYFVYSGTWSEQLLYFRRFHPFISGPDYIRFLHLLLEHYMYQLL